MAARTKQVEIMIKEFNDYLKNNHIIDEYATEVHLFLHLLLRANCYQGFNWFYEYPFTDIMGKTTMVQTSARTSDKEQLKGMRAYIQVL